MDLVRLHLAVLRAEEGSPFFKNNLRRFAELGHFRSVGIRQFTGNLFRASGIDNRLVPGVAPFVVGRFPLGLTPGAVFLRRLLTDRRGRFGRFERKLRLSSFKKSSCSLVSRIPYFMLWLLILKNWF